MKAFRRTRRPVFLVRRSGNLANVNVHVDESRQTNQIASRDAVDVGVNGRITAETMQSLRKKRRRSNPNDYL